MADTEPIDKTAFSCAGDEKFLKALRRSDAEQFVLCGIEAHICVYQTAADLLDTGYDVAVVADAVSSRTIENKAVGLEAMRNSGAKITSVEMILFELLRTAEHEKFRQIAKLIK